MSRRFVLRTLANLVEVCGDSREASVSREISKLHDTTHRGTLGELLQYFTVNKARGEIVIVIGGKPAGGFQKPATPQ